MPSQRKIDIVGTVKEKLSKAKAVVLSDYRGLTHKQLEELKKSLKSTQAEFLVTKNTLLQKAVTETNSKFEIRNSKLTGPTAALFAYADEAAPLKLLAKFIKTTSLPKIKMGFLGPQELSAADVARLMTLPAREVLLGQLTASLKSPLFGLHRALSWNLQKLVLVLNSVIKIK